MRAVEQGPSCRLNLPRIRAELVRVAADFHAINPQLNSPRERPNEEVLENLLSGYALVDDLLASDIELLAYGNLKYLLELNTRVLCGTSDSRQHEYRKHIEATATQFYESPEGGIRDVMEWAELHRREAAPFRAANIYVRILSQPQLYIEGNHRTGTLVLSYVLGRAGLPPYVLSVENAKGYFDLSLDIKKTRKNGLSHLFRVPRLTRAFARFLETAADPDFLL
jgi:hypothetical protein